MRHPFEFETPGCREVGGDWWFPEKGCIPIEVKMAVSICGSCVHREECAEWGINNERFGIWGGLTESHRLITRRKLGITLREEKSA